MSGQEALRRLPSVHAVLEAAANGEAAEPLPRAFLVAAVRAELEAARQELAAGGPVNGEGDVAGLARRAVARVRGMLRGRLRPVINATGIVLHTNLGRAPTAEDAARAAYEAGRGYLNLEIDLDSGQRSSRQQAVSGWLCRLTGAEAATVVNNNAAATIIVLRAVALSREVIIARGQLVEIGGSFRLPEIMATSGAVLREVGCTNIVRLADYETAIGPNTGALLRVHPSNYRISGFTHDVSLAELVTLGQKYQLPVVDDIGSGALVDFGPLGFHGEPLAARSVAEGADLVLFSGDKLLGGPQAGIIVGRKQWISRIEKDPFMRAFRLDKMTIASLEATLRLYLDETRAWDDVPVLRMLRTPLAELRGRAQQLAGRLEALGHGLKVSVAEDTAFVGGGSLPEQALPSWVVELEPADRADAQLAQRLRTGEPAVLARVRDGKVVLDVRTVFPHQEGVLLAAIGAAIADRRD